MFNIQKTNRIENFKHQTQQLTTILMSFPNSLLYDHKDSLFDHLTKNSKANTQWPFPPPLIDSKTYFKPNLFSITPENPHNTLEENINNNTSRSIFAPSSMEDISMPGNKFISDSIYKEFMSQYHQVSERLPTDGNKDIYLIYKPPPLFAFKINNVNYKLFLKEAFQCEFYKLDNFILLRETLHGVIQNNIAILYEKFQGFLDNLRLPLFHTPGIKEFKLNKTTNELEHLPKNAKIDKEDNEVESISTNTSIENTTTSKKNSKSKSKDDNLTTKMKKSENEEDEISTLSSGTPTKKRKQKKESQKLKAIKKLDLKDHDVSISSCSTTDAPVSASDLLDKLYKSNSNNKRKEKAEELAQFIESCCIPCSSKHKEKHARVFTDVIYSLYFYWAVTDQSNRKISLPSFTCKTEFIDDFAYRMKISDTIDTAKAFNDQGKEIVNNIGANALYFTGFEIKITGPNLLVYPPDSFSMKLNDYHTGTLPSEKEKYERKRYR